MVSLDRRFIPPALLGLGLVWFFLALVDRLLGTAYLASIGLILFSGHPIVSRDLFFVFYSLTIGALVISLLSPNRRRFVFGRLVSQPTEAGPPEPLDAGPRSRWATAVRWSLVAASNALILGVRFVIFPWPQGSDTALYIGATNSFLFRGDLSPILPFSGLGVGRSLTVAFIVLLRGILTWVPGNSELMTAMLLPPILGFAYSVSMYAFVRLTTGNRSLAFWTASIAPASFMTIRLSYDIFAQFLGLSFAIVALGALSACLTTKKVRPWVVSSLFLITFLVHFWTWAIFMLISCPFVLWVLYALPEERRRTALRAATAILPGTILAGVFLYALSTLWVAAVYPFSVGDAQPFTYPRGWFWIGGWESGVVWIFSLLGFLIAVFGPVPRVLRVILLLWTSILSILIFVAGYDQSYRFIIVYPIPVLVVLGLRYAAQKIIAWSRTAGDAGGIPRHIAPIALSLILIASVVPLTYVPIYTYWPGQRGYDELVAIRNAYGFGNTSIGILIDIRNVESSFYWAGAVTGAKVYPGNLLGLLRGDPYREDRNLWREWDTHGIREVLIPFSLYTPNSFERSLLSPSKEPMVLTYRMSDGFSPSGFLANTNLLLANSFANGWTLDDAHFVHSFNASNTSLSWDFVGQAPRAERRWVSYERSLTARAGQSLYFLSAGSLGGAGGILQVLYSDGSTTDFPLGWVWEGRNLNRVALEPTKLLVKLRIVFWIDPDETTNPGWLEISYMAILPAQESS